MEATGEAQKIYLEAAALSKRISLISSSLANNTGANMALKYRIAEAYLESLDKLAHPDKQIIMRKGFSNPDDLFEKSFNNFENTINLPDLDLEEK